MAAAAGADAIGVNLWPGSKRYVDAGRGARRRSPPSRRACSRSACSSTRRPTRSRAGSRSWAWIARSFMATRRRPHFGGMDPRALIRAVRVRDEASFDAEAGWPPALWLYDAFVDGFGGGGVPAPWPLIARARAAAVPAGGRPDARQRRGGDRAPPDPTASTSPAGSRAAPPQGSRQGRRVHCGRARRHGVLELGAVRSLARGGRLRLCLSRSAASLIPLDGWPGRESAVGSRWRSRARATRGRSPRPRTLASTRPRCPRRRPAPATPPRAQAARARAEARRVEPGAATVGEGAAAIMAAPLCPPVDQVAPAMSARAFSPPPPRPDYCRFPARRCRPR